MTEAGLDRLLIWMMLMAPAAMLVLGKWQASRERPYVSAERLSAPVFGADFQSATARLLAGLGDPVPLILLADRDCPCTKPSLRALDQAIAQRSDPSQRTPGSTLKVLIHYLDEPVIRRDGAWTDVIRALPSTPSLLAICDGRLVYAGPVTAGSLCSRSGQKIPGIAALLALRDKPVLNWLERGCYCALPAASP